LAAQQSRAGPIVVSADQLDAALDELLDTRNAMTRVLLGGRNGEVPTIDREAHHSHWPD